MKIDAASNTVPVAGDHAQAVYAELLDTLESDGLVSRTIEERDARRHAIQITDAGRAMAEAAVPRVAEPLTRTFAGPTSRQAQQFADLRDSGGRVRAPNAPGKRHRHPESPNCISRSARLCAAKLR